MNTVCTEESLEFQSHGRQRVVADFRSSRISSDGGSLLLREVDTQFGLIEQASECFSDFRDQRFVEHDLVTMLRQRTFGICLGYEDLNDHDALQSDSLLALACGRSDLYGTDRSRAADRGKSLASSSTLNRLELAVPAQGEVTPRIDRYHKMAFDPNAGQHIFTTFFAQRHQRPPKQIILDVDATDDLIHGKQEGRFFHGYYRNYCYLPLYIFAGDHLLWAELRTSDQDGSTGTVDALAHIIHTLRDVHGWTTTQFIVRGDSGFCRDALMTWCEQHSVDYILGLARNERLVDEMDLFSAESRRHLTITGESVKRFHAFVYRTQTSWSRSRLVIGKAEALPPNKPGGEIKENRRFIVTTLRNAAPDELYNDWYCQRGDMENRIKEQQLCLFADRTSTAFLWSNQIRLWFSSIAYCLMQALRNSALKGTKLAKAQCSTIRNRLLKIGAFLRTTTRRIIVHLSGSHPGEPIFRQAYAALAIPRQPG